MKRAIYSFVMATAMLADTAASRFESALYKEQVEGDLNAAIQLYKQVSKEAGRPLAAKALLRMAHCYEKLGNSDAKTTYERIVREYADQGEAAGHARRALVKYEIARSGAGESATRRIATLPGPAPVASDGRHIYYSDLRQPSVTIMKRNLMTGEERSVITGKYFASGLAVTSDGARLALVQRKESPSGLRFSVVVTGTNGSGPQTFDMGSEVVIPLAWSPDGQDLLLFRLPVPNSGKPPSLRLLRPATGAIRTLRELPRDYRASTVIATAFSPDGKWIAYDAMTENSERRSVYLVSSDGTQHRAIIDGPGNASVVGWMPGTTELLFLSDRSGSIDMYAVTIGEGALSGSPRLVKENAGVIKPVGWGRNSLLYIPQNRRHLIMMGTVDLAIGEIRNPVPMSSRYVSAMGGAQLSPDGKSLAYISTARPLAEGRPTLVIRDVKSGTEKSIELFPALGMVQGWNWSHDSQAYFLSGWPPSGVRVSLRVTVGTGEMQVFRSSKTCSEPFPDVDHVLCFERLSGRDVVSFDFAISKLNWRTGADEILIEKSGGMTLHPLSPDGKFLAYWSPDGETLRVRDLQSGSDRDVFRRDAHEVKEQRPFMMRWLGDDKVLLRRHRQGYYTWVVPIDSRPAWRLPGNDWTDDKVLGIRLPEIVFSEIFRSTDVWALENLPRTASAGTKR